MARIDLLTAQMCRRTAQQLRVQSDQKMQFFGAGGEPLGEGAALSGPMIHEILLPIAPIPFDGVPVSFPYKGCDGEFKILVAAKCRGFEIHALSFAAPQKPTNFSKPPQAGGPKTAFECNWATPSKGSGAPPEAKPSLRVTGFGFGTYGPSRNSPEETTEDDAD